jgi:hypothetical protein
VTVSYCGNFWDLTCSFLLPNIYMIMQCSLLLEVRNVLVIFSIMATSWDLTHAPILCTNYKWFLPLVYSFMESWNHSGIRQVTGMQTQVCSVVRNFHLGSPPPPLSLCINAQTNFIILLYIRLSHTGWSWHVCHQPNHLPLGFVCLVWHGYVMVGLPCGLAAYHFGLPLTFYSGLYTVFRCIQSVYYLLFN